MHTHNIARWLLIAVLCVLPGIGSASSSFEEMLQEADRIRSSDRVRFTSILEALEASSGEADPAQREHLQYLRVYALVLHSEQMEQGIEQAKALFNQTKDLDLKYRAGSLVANSSAINRNFSEGLRYIDQTLAMRKQVRDRGVRHDGMSAAAVLYNQLGQYQLGRYYAQEILADSPGPRAHCFAGHLLAEAQESLGTLPVDDAPLMLVIDQCAAHGEKIVANAVRVTLARKWAAEGQRGKAIALLRDHLAEVKAARYAYLIGLFESVLAELLLADGDAVSAEQYAKSAIAQSASLAKSLSLVMAHKVLYDIAESRADSIGALSHYRNYANADKAYVSDVKARELAYQMVRHETLQKTQEIELLNRRNQVLQLQQAVDKQAAQNTRLLVALLIVMLAVLSYWAWGIKRRQLSLRRLAEMDALTGVSNRHHFTLQSERALVACAKAGEPVALLMFDLDHFKAINDSYGHVTGDWVLTRVGDVCRSFCRRIDCLGRLGGEEFAFLMHGIDLASATRLAEDCRVRIASIDTHDSGHKFAITASFGVSTTAWGGYDLARLLAQADQSLYRAKREGRNKVRAFNGDAPGVPAAPTAQVIAIDGRTVS